MKKIFLIPTLVCAMMSPLTAIAQDDTEAPAVKRDYSFKSKHPLTQIESLYSAIMAATPKGVQNTLGLELIASKDSIKRMALNPTGINVALVKKNKKGIYYLETYTTDGEEDKLMAFDAKHLGIPYAAAYTPDARQLVVAADKGTYIFETKKFKQIGEAPAFSNHPDMLVFSPNAYFLAAAGDKQGGGDEFRRQNHATHSKSGRNSNGCSFLQVK